MGDRTGISWTDATWSPVTGCSRVSPGCANCYAETLTAGRLSKSPRYAGLADAEGHWTGEVRCHPELLDQPLRWKRPRRIFVCSMSDLFHDKVPWPFICEVFDMMALAPQHTFQVLTKRPGRMAHFANVVWPWFGKGTPSRYGGAWPPNVWAGTSVESQKYAPRLDCLARVPAKVRFVSVEPMLGPVDLGKWLGNCYDGLPDNLQCITRWNAPILSWVIVGGESGPGARPMDLAWARDLVGQCRTSGVTVFVKQLGRNPVDSEILRDSVDGRGNMLWDPKGADMDEWSADLRVREFP